MHFLTTVNENGPHRSERLIFELIDGKCLVGMRTILANSAILIACLRVRNHGFFVPLLSNLQLSVCKYYIMHFCATSDYEVIFGSPLET